MLGWVHELPEFITTVSLVMGMDPELGSNPYKGEDPTLLYYAAQKTELLAPSHNLQGSKFRLLLWLSLFVHPFPSSSFPFAPPNLKT